METNDLPVNQTDVINAINNFVPAKYQHLAVLIFGVVCIAGRVYLAWKNGHGAIAGGVKAVVLGDSAPIPAKPVTPQYPTQTL